MIFGQQLNQPKINTAKQIEINNTRHQDLRGKPFGVKSKKSRDQSFHYNQQELQNVLLNGHK